MSISNVFFNFWRKISMPLLVLSLTLCYFAMPDNAAIHHDEKGNPDGYIDKQTFFYAACGIIIVFNFLLNLLKSQVIKIDFAKLNPLSIWAKNAPKLNGLIEGWFNAFLALTNTFMVFVLFGLRRINSGEGQKLDFDYNWLLIAGATLLIILIFFLPMRLLFSNPSKE